MIYAIETGDTVRFLKKTWSALGHVRCPGDIARVTCSWEHGRVINVEWDDGFFFDIVPSSGVVEKVLESR